MHRLRCTAILLALLLAASMTACDTPSDGTGGAQSAIVTPSATDTVVPDTVPTLPTVTDPVVGEVPADDAAVAIQLGERITVTGDGATVDSATIDGNIITIRRTGTYVVSGTLADGQLVVDTEDTKETLTILLNGASLSCSTGPAIYVRNASDVVIQSAKGSVNLLSDQTGYVVPDEEQVEGETYPNACVYACTDLWFAGEGEIHIIGNADKGVNTKDTLAIVGGTLTVNAVGVGLRGNDGFGMEAGTLTVVSGGDGIKTANTEKASKGRMAISGGALYVTAKGDALSAATDLSLFDGVLVLHTVDENGESLKETTGNPASGSSGGFGGRPGGFGESTSDKASISAKGIKAAGELVIAGGQITIVAQDDGLHTNGNLTVSGGTTHIRSADDGMHADGDLVISGGVNEIAQSYEGLEALHITVSGGVNRITASDDGANASDGSGGGFGGMGGMPGGGRPGMWGGSSGSIEFSEDQPCLTFAGGYTVFNAGGDGIDSNGWIKMNGGTVIVYGPTDNGNGPIDTGDGGYTMTVSGGTFLAVGSSGMAETADNGGQAVVAAYWRNTGLAAGETIAIVDEGGKVLAAFELPKSIASIVFSSPDLQAGKSYSVVTGGNFTGSATDGVIDPATYTGYESMGKIEAY